MRCLFIECQTSPPNETKATTTTLTKSMWCRFATFLTNSITIKKKRDLFYRRDNTSQKCYHLLILFVCGTTLTQSGVHHFSVELNNGIKLYCLRFHLLMWSSDSPFHGKYSAWNSIYYWSSERASSILFAWNQPPKNANHSNSTLLMHNQRISVPSLTRSI